MVGFSETHLRLSVEWLKSRQVPPVSVLCSKGKKRVESIVIASVPADRGHGLACVDGDKQVDQRGGERLRLGSSNGTRDQRCCQHSCAYMDILQGPAI